MTLWAIVFVASTALAAIGFVMVAVTWLKRLRDTLAVALGETAGQQIRSAQRLSEAIATVQRQQQLCDQRLQILAEANLRMQHELNELAGRVDTGETDKPTPQPSRMIH